MSDLTAWYLNQLDTHGVWTVLAAQAVIVLATFCIVGGAWTLADRWTNRQHIDQTVFLEADDGIHHLEHHANHTANRRREDTP